MRRLVTLLAVVGLTALLPTRAWAPITYTTPNTFATQSGNVPASQLDANFSAAQTALSGIALSFADVAGLVGKLAALTYTNATTVSLGPGALPLKVGSAWTVRTITTAPTLSNASLAASTTYWVYAYDASGTTTLVALTGGHAADTTTEIEVLATAVAPCGTDKSLCAFVGLVRTNGSSQFEQDASLLGVRSWYRRAGGALSVTTTNASYGSLAMTTFGTAVGAVLFADDLVQMALTGTFVSGGISGGAVTSGIYLDGSVQSQQPVVGVTLASANFTTAPVVIPTTVAEGYHTVQAGLGTVALGANINISVYLTVGIR